MSETPDTIYHNTKIYTVDPQKPWAEALSVKGSQITAVGSVAELLPHAGPATQLVDLGGAMTMPGLHDAHVHLLEQSFRNIGVQCSLDNPQTLDELAAQLTEYWAKNSRREWLIAGIYNSQKLPNDIVTKQFLDDLFPDTPVILYDHTAVHVCVVNSTALKLSGITRDTPDPDCGVIVRDEDGKPTGWLTESATALVRLKVPPYDEEEVDRALEYATAVCAQYGITSVQEAATYRPLMEGLKRLEARGVLKTHVFAHLVYNFPAWGGWGTEEFDALRKVRDSYRSERVTPDGVKIFLDGTSLPPQFTHVPLDERTGDPITDNLMIPQEELVRRIGEWTDEGLKVKAHASGMGAVRVGLDVYEKALRDRTPRIPHDLAHCRWVSQEDISRFSSIGVVGEMSPTIWQDPSFKDGLNGAFRFASLRKSGAKLSLGSDWILPQTPNLFPGLGGIVEWGDEGLTVAEAIEMATLNGAKSVGKDDRFGSLVSGKDATFIVLDRNPFEVPTEYIKETRVTRTVLQGETVFISRQSVTEAV